VVAGNQLGWVLRPERRVGLKGVRNDEGASRVGDGPVRLRTAVGRPAAPDRRRRNSAGHAVTLG